MPSSKVVWIIVGLVVLSLILFPFLGGAGMMGWGMMGPVAFSGWGLMMLLPMVLFWGAIIVGIVFLVRSVSQGGNAGAAPGRQDSALEILKQRYARGEISKEEFEEMKRDLAGTN